MSGVLTELAVRQNRMVWLLEIDGLQKTYYSSPAAPILPAYTEAWTHTAAAGIVSVTAADQELDILESVATAGQVAVTIAITRTNDADRFLAVGRSGSPYMATLAVTLEQTGAGFVTVNEDISAWPATGELWIGKECIVYTARSVVAPFRFTIPVPSARGWWGSEQRKHVASPVVGWAPRVYSQCVTWQNRKARVLVSTLRPDGSQATGWVEYVTGRIVSNPEVSQDGLQVALNIIPHTDALGISVGGGVSRTGLQQGLHTFDGVAGDLIVAEVSFGLGDAWSQDSTFNSLLLTQIPIKYKVHQDTFDLLAVDSAGRPDDQRRGIIIEEGTPGVTQAITSYAGGDRGIAPGDLVNISPGTPLLGNLRETWRNAPAANRLSVSVLTTPGSAEVIQWPDGALARASFALSPGNHLDVLPVLGQFADIGFDPNNEIGPAVTVSMNSHAAGQARARLTTWDESPLILYYGVSTFAPDDLTRVWMLETGQHRRTGTTTVRTERVAANNEAVVWSDGAIRDRVAIPIRGFPNAYYQRGELYIHVEDDFTTGGPVLIRWTEWDGTEHRQSIDTTGAIAANTIAPFTAPGTLLKVNQDTDDFAKSFGDWPGQDRCTLEQDVSWNDALPGSILLNVLMSGEGAGFNSGYDIFPNGANLRSTEVDIDSFLRYPYPDGLAQRLTLSLNDWESITIREFMEPILRSIGGAIVLRVEQVAAAGAGGVLRRRLALEPVTSEYAADALGSILNGDWFSGGRPSTSDDDRLVNSMRIKTGYTNENDSFDLTVNISDRDSIGEYGLAAIDELDLRGVTMPAGSPADQTARLLPFSAARFAQVGAPRRQIEGSIAWADAVLLNAGSTVIVSAVDIYGYDGARGISAQPMRVVSINGDGYMQTARIKLTWHDSTVSGWAPSLKIAAVTNPSTYTVEANIYTELADPITSQPLADVDYWAAGDSIRACPLGNYGASTGGLTVLSIVGNVVTLSAPAVPALVAGDTLRPDVYTALATTSAQQAYAYLGDDAGGLGVTPDPAKLYA